MRWAGALGLSISLTTLAAAQGAIDPAVQDVALVALIANPAQYDGKRVRVVGYFEGQQPEDCALFMSKADLEQLIIASSIHVYWRGCHDWRVSRTMYRRYVVVQGTFHAARAEGYALDATGAIDPVTDFRPNLSRSDFEKSYTWSWEKEYGPRILVILALASILTGCALRIVRRFQR